MKNIILFQPDNDLMEKVTRLPKGEYSIVGSVDANPKDLFQYDFDFICIPLRNYREIKQELMQFFDCSMIHTYEELRVLGSERLVNQRIIKKWKTNNKLEVQDNEGRTVIVFGGASGIGYSCAEAFSLTGATVIIAGRNEERLMKAAKELGVFYLMWDISRVEQNEMLLAKARSLVGGRIDTIVNSAGVFDLDSTSFFEVTEKVYDTVMDTNLKGAFFLCQTFSEYFIREGIEGHIVNIVSETGCSPTVKPYGISKWGLWGFTRGLGLTLAKYNITVNGVAPGEVATEMTGWGGKEKNREPARRGREIGRVLFSREVAEWVLFLSSESGRIMPGEVITLNGGQLGRYIGLNY